MRKVDPVKHASKRREILEAAGRCFVRNGLRSASIADICAEAHIGAGHLYHYFDGKEAIIEAMIELDLAQGTDASDESDEAGDPVHSLVSEFERRATIGKGGPGLMFDAFAEAGRNPVIAKLLQHHAEVTRARIATRIRRGQAAGHVDPALDPDETATLLLAVLQAGKVLALGEAKSGLKPTILLVELMLARFLRPDR